MEATTNLIPTGWTFERLGRGLAFGRSSQDRNVVVMLTGSRGDWVATADPVGTTVHGPVVTGTTQQEACENAWVALKMQQEGMV